MFKKILIANRGEIALRIQRSCSEMGIATVAVHSSADTQSMAVQFADESVCIGPPASAESYLNMRAIISAANITGAEAIHPGYGFLAENADFAEMVEAHGLCFIGPTCEHIRIMGDKIQAKKTALKLGLPIVPGSQGAVASAEQAREIADKIQYPVLIKAASGGGGRGMKVVKQKNEMEESFTLCRQEALAAFGSEEVYIEKYLPTPRHIEVQVCGDGKGEAQHFWERDCSLQRRHQKVIEEAPANLLKDDERQKICEQAQQCSAKLGYRGAGTFEFLYQDGEFYFIEMNTRIQVEHPVSESICGVDLIAEQILIAADEKKISKQPPKMLGHAIELRINAEHPETFAPSPGTIGNYHAPGGLGVRVDSALFRGYKVPPYYDSLIAKLIIQAPSRKICIERAMRALNEYAIEGINTNIALHKKILASKEFADGKYDIHWLENSLI